MLRRIAYVGALCVVVLLLLAYAAAVLPVLPWWSWPLAVLATIVLRRWYRVRRMGDPGIVDPDGPRWSPTRGGGK